MNILNLHDFREKPHNAPARALQWLQAEIPGLAVVSPRLDYKNFAGVQETIRVFLRAAEWDLVVCSGWSAFFALGAEASGSPFFLLHPCLFPAKDRQFLEEDVGTWPWEETEGTSKRIMRSLSQQPIVALVSSDGQLTHQPYFAGKLLAAGCEAKDLKAPLRRTLLQVQREKSYEPPVEFTASLTRADLERILRATDFMVEHNRKEDVLEGITLRFRAGTLTAACEDGRVFAFVRCECDPALDRLVVLDPEALEDFLESSESSMPEFVNFIAYRESVVLRAGAVRAEGYLLHIDENTGPDFTNEIPPHFERRIEVGLGRLKDALFHLWYWPQGSGTAEVVFLLERESLELAMEYTEPPPPRYEEHRCLVAACEGEMPFRMAIHRDSLEEILEHCAGKTLEIHLNGEHEAVLFRTQEAPNEFWVLQYPNSPCPFDMPF
jgi:hypothetical protein